MRRLIFLYLLFISSTALGQMTEHLAGPFAAYRGQHSGMKMPYLLHIPPNAEQTRAGTGHINEKYPLIIDFHGIGERTSSFASMSAVTTADLTKLYNNGIPPKLRTTTSSLVGKTYTVPGQTAKQFIYISPQCYGGYSYFYPTYGYNAIKTAKETLADILDTGRIYFAGLSFGGGAVWTMLQDKDINSQVAGAIANCPGYFEYVWNSPKSDANRNLRNIADWGGILIACHSTNDDVTDPSPSGIGSWYTDRGVDSVLKYNGITTLVVYRWTTGGHYIWDRAYSPSNQSVTYPVFNGNLRGFATPFQQMLLPYSTDGRRNPNAVP